MAGSTFDGKIIWLASYPRSGNTWLRFLLTNVFLGPVNSSAEVGAFCPDIHMQRAEAIENRDTGLVKTHFMLTDGLPYLANTVGAIYLVRNPLDMIVSSANYFLRGLQGVQSMSETEVDDLRRRIIDGFIEWGGAAQFIRWGYGTWSAHLASWSLNEDFPVLFVKYENLLAEALAETRRILEFLNHDAAGAELEAAIENASFANMKKIEEREIETRLPGPFYGEQIKDGAERGLRFLNRGGEGQGKGAMTAEQMDKACENFRPLMEKFGYSE